MSSPISCDACGKSGRRRKGTYCPKGWLYTEVVDDDEEIPEDERVLIIAVCSEKCARSIWTPGPGKLDLTLGI